VTQVISSRPTDPPAPADGRIFSAEAAMARDHFWIDLDSDHLSVRYAEPDTYYMRHHTLMMVPFASFAASAPAAAPPAAAAPPPRRASEPPAHLLCPITRQLMEDPVMATDGHTYERAAMEGWLRSERARGRSPVTNMPLEHTRLVPNYAVKAALEEWAQHPA
jgi:hypothetical protein